MQVKGDLVVKRTISAERRLNQGMNTETLAGNRTVVVHDYSWLNLDPDGTDRDVTLPDATTLPLGWKIVIAHNGSADSLIVKASGGSPTLKTIVNPAVPGDLLAYEFVCTDIGTAAGGWYVVEIGDPGVQTASKFVANFLIADWPAAGGGYQILTSTQVAGLGVSAHGRGANPMLFVQEKTGTDHDRVLVDRERVDASGNVTLRITDGSAFDGRVVLV